MSDPITAALITGFVSAIGTFVSLATFVGRRIDRLDEKFDRKFDMLMVELLRHVREGHPPTAA